MTSVEQSLEALGLTEEKKRESASVDTSMRALGLAETPTTVAGVGKAAFAALPKVIANMAGTPAALDQLSKQASAWLASKVTGKSAEDIQAATASMPGPMAAWLGQGATIPPEVIRAQMEKVTGPLYEPQNRAEKLADTFTQFAVSMGRPGVKGLTAAAGGAIGTEAAGAATNDNAWARFGGGLLGGAAPTMVNAWQNAPAKAIQQAVGMPSNKQMTDALWKQGEAQRLGVPLMGAESMPNSGLQQLAADVNASRQGSPVMRQFLEQRPDQVRQATHGLLDDIAVYRSPGEAAQLAERTAANVLSGKSDEYMALGSNAARTARTSPFWEAQKTADLAAVEQAAKQAELSARLQGRLGDIQQWTAGRQQSANDAVQQYGQMRGMQNDLWQLTEKAKVPGLGAEGNQRARDLARQSGEAKRTADDFYNVANTRKSEAQAGQAAEGWTERQLAALAPKPTELDYGLQSIIGNLDSEIALAGANTDKGRILSELRGQLGGLKTPTQADNVYQAFSKRLQVGATASTEDRIAAGILAEPTKALGALVEQVSPRIAEGRRLYQQITEQHTNPLRSSLIGKMAPKEGYYDPADVTNIARVTRTLKGVDTAEIRQLYTHLNAQDRTAFPAVARGYLENAFDSATARGQPGENRMMGVNFAKAVMGTDQERANFNEILRGVAQANGAKPDEFVKGANVLMQTFEATGKVPGVGSPTAGRQELQSQLSKTVTGNAFGMVSTQPLSWAKQTIGDAAMGGRYRQLAQVLTAPDSVQQIIKMAKLKPDGMTARYYASQLFSATREAE